MSDEPRTTQREPDPLASAYLAGQRDGAAQARAEAVERVRALPEWPTEVDDDDLDREVGRTFAKYRRAVLAILGGSDE